MIFPEAGAGEKERSFSPERWVRILEKISAWTASAFLVVNLGDILAGVFCRYVLRSSLIWTEEAARFSLVWMVMAGALGAMVRGEYMVIDFVVPRFPRGVRRLVIWGRFLLGILILGLMTVLGSINALQMWNMKTLALHIPKTLPLLALPVGFGLLLAGTLLSGLREGKE
ncbi:MAG TPA: TRAP transporter small permease [Synergistaceae bacterium]|nr:TRAP transporter small permease [Synergistaceae bacterium]